MFALNAQNIFKMSPKSTPTYTCTPIYCLTLYRISMYWSVLLYSIVLQISKHWWIYFDLWCSYAMEVCSRSTWIQGSTYSNILKHARDNRYWASRQVSHNLYLYFPFHTGGVSTEALGTSWSFLTVRDDQLVHKWFIGARSHPMTFARSENWWSCKQDDCRNRADGSANKKMHWAQAANRILTAVMQYSYWIQLHNTISRCSDSIQLRNTVSQYRYSIWSLHTVTQYSYAIQLRSTAAQYIYSIQVLSTVTQYSYSLQLLNTVGQDSDSIQLIDTVLEDSWSIQLRDAVTQYR